MKIQFLDNLNLMSVFAVKMVEIIVGMSSVRM